ncbi:putative lipoprotein [Synechococcus sp. RS9915]|nr:putative lipoprotein [Synechococcus sp. RS9915]
MGGITIAQLSAVSWVLFTNCQKKVVPSDDPSRRNESLPSSDA